jgi:hypothetical protein
MRQLLHPMVTVRWAQACRHAVCVLETGLERLVHNFDAFFLCHLVEHALHAECISGMHMVGTCTRPSACRHKA